MRKVNYFLQALFIFLSFQYSVFSQTAQFEQSFTFTDDYFNSQVLILGYDPFGTEGLDPALGEVVVSPVPAGNFGVRFQLPVSGPILTTKDIRFGCGQPFYYEHLIDLSYMTGSFQIDITWTWDWPLWTVQFINPVNHAMMAMYGNGFDPPNFSIPFPMDKIILAVFYDGPLSWPEYTMIAPNGGELLHSGEIFNISWENNQIGMSLDIEFSTDNGTTWNYIVQNISNSLTSYNWLVPQLNSEMCLIRIGDYPCAYDQSLGTFVIYENNPPMLNPVNVPFQIMNSIGNSIQLTAGMHPDATNGIDTALGESQMTLPPTGVFGAAMKLDNGILTQTDYRPGYSTYIGDKIYNFVVQPNLDTVVFFRMNVPNGVIPSLFIVKSVPGGIGFIDTTFNDNSISYQLPTKTFFQGYGGFPGIRLTLHFDGTVPVELLSFTAETVGDNVSLDWKTATETNNEGWDIERSKENDYFTKIGFVEGAGTSTEMQTYSYHDKIGLARIYFYRLKQIDYDGTFEYSNTIEVNVGIPQKFSLEQNYPNPFNPVTWIKYSIPSNAKRETQDVKLIVFDMLGREVKILVNEPKEPGNYEVKFDASGLSSGVYFYRLKAGDYLETIKMLLLK